MRKLASFTDHAAARAASSALDAADIANDLRVELDKQHAVWVLLENQVADARRVLSELAAGSATQPPAAAPEQPKPAAPPETPPVRTLPNAPVERTSVIADLAARLRGAPVTATVIAVSTALALASALGAGSALERSLMIASRMTGHDYDDLLAGELWRLVTPALLHAGAIHLLFNVVLLLELGAVIERVTGSLRFALLLIFCAAASNLAQLQLGGSPSFYGLSGLVYACLGYLWSRGRFDPTSPVSAPQQLVSFFMIWLVLGFSGVLSSLVGPIANYCHLGGLVAGAACGYVSALANKHRLRRSAQH